MKNRTQRDPLDYGLNIYGSKHPFDFGLIFKVSPWVDFDDNKIYLQSLEKHWILLYEWKTHLMNCNKQQKKLYYTVARLFIAIFLGQFILTINENSIIAKHNLATSTNKKISKDIRSTCKIRHNNTIYNNIGWSTKSISIRSVALLFIMQIEIHNSLNQFFADVSTTYKIMQIGHDWYHYMNLLLKDIKHSNCPMPELYHTLDEMLKVCFPNEIKL